MDGSKKRRWFQFHLSTCLVFVFTLGPLVFLNMQYERDVTVDVLRGVQLRSRNMDDATPMEVGAGAHGFPFPRRSYYFKNKYGSYWLLSGVIKNIAVAFAIVFSACYLWEVRILGPDKKHSAPKE